MGSESSKGGVNDFGVDYTKKEMILESHSYCVKLFKRNGVFDSK